jgi:triosephosphate isomerase
MRKKIVAGNWKMNKTLAEAEALTRELVAATTPIKTQASIILCPPFLYLSAVKGLLAGTHLQVGAQNCSEHESGAYTGEVSAAMLQSIGVPYVIIGHSERRQYFGETGATLAKKVDRALANHLTPIFCCGEPLEVREKNGHEALVKKQTEEALFHLSPDKLSEIVIAYEPVWAIGTGKTATSQQAQDMHAVIRRHLESKYGAGVAGEISILYGGSVKPDNAKELFSCPDVDGGLVGGASLKASDFVGIIQGAG